MKASIMRHSRLFGESSTITIGVTSKPMEKPIIPTLAFKTAKSWNSWLAKNHAKPLGIWLRFFKKDSGEKSITYAEALQEALCYGWIDGQANKGDEKSWIQKFTPRRKNSMWSKRNIGYVEQLIKDGKMKPAGLKEFEDAKAGGRHKTAYDSPSNMEIPSDFLKELSKNKKAKAFFDTLNKSNTYAIAWRLQTAKKPETRERRMEVILKMMKEGKKFH
jgi:uncharacterized protein YdeI (YjbR/CyaY-like superfamily)